MRFPDIGEPNLSSATGCGDSYKEQIKDSVITSTTDANYKITRPRTTRMISTWTFCWNAMSDENYAVLKTFFKTVGTFEAFQWVNPIDGNEYTVRFAEDFSAQEVYPVGWKVTLKFEEV